MVASNTPFTADDIYKAVADGELAFDMYHDEISKSEKAIIYRDQSALNLHRFCNAPEATARMRAGVTVSVGTRLRYDGVVSMVVMMGLTNVMLRHGNGNQIIEVDIELLADYIRSGRIVVEEDPEGESGSEEAEDEFAPILANDSRIKRALKRAQIIEHANYSKIGLPVTIRTVQRWKADLRNAGENIVARQEALMDDIHQRGSRQPKIPEWQIEIIEKICRKHLNNFDAWSKKKGYILFWRVVRIKGAQLGIDVEKRKPASKTTFLKYVRDTIDVLKREGRRVWESVRPIDWTQDISDIHGNRPFHIVHIDSTQLDIHARHPAKRESLGRPWLTVAIDAYTRTVLAIFISFRKPGYRSTMMVLRDMVRRKGRLPDILVMDGGPEFRNSNLDRLLERYGVKPRWRKKPRQGSVVERYIGTVTQQLINDLEGNSKFMKRVRQMTRETFPENRVAWTLTALYFGMEFYFDEIYGNRPHPDLGVSPNAYFKAKLIETGERLHLLIPYTREFLIWTCPRVGRTGTRKVSNTRGIKISWVPFHADILKESRLNGKNLDVKVDDWDPRMAYVLVDKHWHNCFSKFFRRLATATLAERKAAWDEYKLKTAKAHSQMDQEEQEKYLYVYDYKNFDPLLRTQMDEERRLYGPLNMTVADAEAWRGYYGDSVVPVRPKPANKRPSSKGDGRMRFSRARESRTSDGSDASGQQFDDRA
jgi:putative transposase